MMLYICTALYIIHNIYRKGKKTNNYIHICMGYFCFFGQESKYVVACLQIRIKGQFKNLHFLCNEHQIEIVVLSMPSTSTVHAQVSTNFTDGYANKFDNHYIMGQIIELPLDKLWDKSIHSSGLILELYQVHRNFKSQFYITSQTRDFFLTTKHLKERKELVFPTIKD